MGGVSSFTRISVCALLGVVLSAGVSLGAEGGAQLSKDACLECHGPFDRLAAATAGYTASSGEKITPHRYVPHDKKGIPECANCHQPHPLQPVPRKLADARPDVQWCFTNCHHRNNFETCKNCHT